MSRFASFTRCSDFNEPWRLRHDLKDKHHRQAGTTPTHMPRRRSQGRRPARSSRPARRSRPQQPRARRAAVPGSGSGSSTGRGRRRSAGRAAPGAVATAERGSALAAAILATTLTGRTVAIPQPRQRSLSEGDSTYLEQECLEPYATVTELGIGSNWNLDGCDRSPLQSLEITGNYGEDEDMDTYLSDADKEAESSCQSNEKREGSFSTNAIYAVPCKPKTEEFPPSPVPNADKKEVSSHETQCQVVVDKSSVQIEEDQNLGLNLKEEKLVAVNLIQDKPPPSPGELTELLSLRQQAQELVDENDALKRVVHRLNVELSRYQTKFRSLSQEEKAKLKSLPMEGPQPPWLLDMKYLSPLLLAYEDRIREKEDFILEHEEDMKNFKARVEELVKENEDLHGQLNNFITPTEWQLLQTQAKLVLEENAVLMEQLKIQQAKAKDSHRQHVQEASKLTKQIVILEGKNKSQEEEITEYQKQLEALCSTCEELKAKVDSRITAEEHLAVVNDLKSCLQQEQEKKLSEVEAVMGKIASLQTENKKLLLEKNNFMADKKILETEMQLTQKTNRRLKKKIGVLQLQLEEAMEKEVAAHHYLANLIGLVEKTAKERDHLVFLARCLENENQGVLKKIIEGSLRLGRLEEKVKIYKKKAAGKLGDINLKMSEQEKEFERKTAQYEQEKKHLQRLLQDKQETLREVLEQNRKTEGELEIMWESTAKENKRMRELLQKSLRKNTWSAVTAHDPHSQKDLVYGHDFSYCDVKTSSPTENEIQQECQ
ncbi:centrosomal protein of 89 kDa isoform X3 [Agelaius phoeniceus]|uniref:centrosomal protein of 89 kDa isoform X3 n=1 Tax=Agelaius phoeniceus TaxID=39638 RepID=UPI0040552156